MKMPFSEAAFVPTAKVTDYLLSRTHARGSTKSVWFEALGFVIEKPDELIEALLVHATHDVEQTEQTRYGTKYRIVGKIVGPNGLDGQLRSIWIVLDGEETPRLVTAYPSK